MIDPLGYRGRRVVVSGCASGMGAATARLLIDLGAEVHGLDFQPCDLPLASFDRIDLRDPASIDAAVGALDGRFYVLFNCAGLGPSFPPLDILRVNFIGTRHLTERILPLIETGGAIGSIASTAAMGWGRRVAVMKEWVTTEGYGAAEQWVAAHPDLGEPYTASKEAIVVWTMIRSQDLIGRDIRINCVMPALTQTPMLTNSIAIKSSPETLAAAILPIGRPATPEEQAFPLVMITAPAATYINGAALNVDGGRLAKLATGS